MASRRRIALRTGAGLVGLLLLAVAAIGAYLAYLNSEIHRVAVHGLSSAAHGHEHGTENILLVGSTSRCALTVQNPAYGLCSQGVNGVNSDVVMVLHLNFANRTVAILSIPRDLFVPNARTTGPNKIDAALYQGPSQLVAAIQDDFGIAIQHYIELNFDTFANVVNALGGVRMYFPEPVFDAYSGLHVTVAGCHQLNGFEALQVVRARHLQYKGPGVTSNNPADWPQEHLSDLARIRRDHEFLRVLARQVAHRGLGNPFTDTQIIAAIAPDLEVDSGLSAHDLANLVLTFHSINIDAAPQLTLPVAVTNFGSYAYEGGDYGDVEFPTQPQEESAIDRVLAVPATINTLTGDPLPQPGRVRVVVRSGSGVAAQADVTVHGLARLGFQVRPGGALPPVAPQAETVVYYATAATEGDALAVAHRLTGYVILGRDASQVVAGSEVTVVTGTGLGVLAPSTAGTAAPQTVSSLPPGAVSAPNAPVSPLQPWDPRSCSPAGGPGP